MARPGRYKTMREMKDEDKWFKFFTKEQILYLAVFGSLGIGVVILFKAIGLTLIGMVFAVVLVALGLILPRFDMPTDKYILGGGFPLKVIALRILLKQLPKNKKIYISMHDCNVEDFNRKK